MAGFGGHDHADGGGVTPETARWLRDEVLPSLTFTGSPGELRVALGRHDQAIIELTQIAEPPRKTRGRKEAG